GGSELDSESVSAGWPRRSRNSASVKPAWARRCPKSPSEENGSWARHCSSRRLPRSASCPACVPDPGAVRRRWIRSMSVAARRQTEAQRMEELSMGGTPNARPGPFPLLGDREREGDQANSTEPKPRAGHRAQFHGAAPPEWHRWHGLHPWAKLFP